MKADVQITLEDDEVFGVLRRLSTVLRKRDNPSTPVESVPAEEPEEQETNEDWEWYKPPPNQRNCTLCGVELIRGENIPTKRINKRDHVCNTCNSKYNKRSEVQQRYCYRCGLTLNESNVGSKFHCICKGCKGMKKEPDNHDNLKTPSSEYTPLTADQRTQWARERREIVGETITQPGAFQGALITEHIRGTHYKVQLPSGDVIDAKHKKQKTLGGDELGAGWSKWEKRS